MDQAQTEYKAALQLCPGGQGEQDSAMSLLGEEGQPQTQQECSEQGYKRNDNSPLFGTCETTSGKLCLGSGSPVKTEVDKLG